MPAAFRQTLRALERESGGLTAIIATGGVVALAWALWLGLGRVTVYVASDTARVVASEGVRAVRAPFDAEVEAVEVALGDAVSAGDPLLRLDDTEARLLFEGAAAERAALQTRLAALESGLEAAVSAEDAASVTGAAELATAQAALEAALVDARLSEEARLRAEGLSAAGAISQAALQQARAAAQRTAAEVKEAERTVAAAAGRAARDRRDRVVVHEDHAGRVSQLEGALLAADRELERLAHKVDQHVLRAPATGHVGALEVRAAGVLVSAGTEVAVVVPEGELRVEATFPAAAASGRIQVGQKARLRLDGFPWTAFGSAEAEVVRVGAEPRSGQLSADLELAALPPGVPAQHGLTGLVEVEVERTSPAVLLLRSAGALMPSGD